MDSWIYLFSQFSKEALLFQGLLISILCVLYSGFWILNKRRFGSVKEAVPSGVVKTYLNELIVDAERAKAQLFGMLGNEGLAPVQFNQAPQIQATQPVAEGAPAQIQVTSDPALAQTIAALEAKLAQQNQIITQFSTEKTTLTKEIETLKAAKPAAGASAGGGTSDQQARIKELEDRLNEYSVIEDDLANLKRLQQENAKLKAQLEGKGGSAAATAAVAAAAPAPSPEPVSDVVMPTLEAAPAAGDDDSELLAAFAAATETAPTAEPVAAAAPTAAPEAKSVSDADLLAAFSEAASASAAPAAAAPKAPVAAAAAPAAAPSQKAVDNIFDNLVNQVEESLQPIPVSPTSVSAAAAEPEKTNSGEDDLISEFEKMLNS